MLKWLLVCLAALSGSVVTQELEMCWRCSCLGKLIDCKGKMKDHLNQTVWQGIIQVEEFILDNNGIVHLNQFPVFGTRRLSLRHNSISSIADSAFLQVTNLTDLDLSYNSLTSHTLRPHIFRGRYSPEKYEPLKNLETLRLTGNILHSLRSDVFEHLPNLKHLYLNSNPFKMIDLSTSLAISSIYYLKVLDLSGCMLSSFPDQLLHTPKYLEVLNLSSNHFTEIPGAIAESHSLDEFVFDDNLITSLRFFPKVSTLRVLRLNWMAGLFSIESGALRNLSRLEEFHCSHNRHLSQISEDAFKQLPVPPVETSTWPPLRKLYLRDNNLAYLDVGLLSRWDILEETDLQENPWVCDCQNQWLLTTLMPLINRTNPNLTAEIMCAEPPELLNTPMYVLSRKKSMMRCLDTYGNQPEKDGRLLVSIFICVLILIPIAMAAIVILSYRLRQENHGRNLPYKHIDETPSTPS